MLKQTKSINATDKLIGARIRLARTTKGMSQEKLGEALGITFQQIQKYEKATNRVGSGRLSDIAAILNRPVAWFYEDVPTTADGAQDEISALLHSAEGIKLMRSYSQIKNHRYREAVHAVIATLYRARGAAGMKPRKPRKPSTLPSRETAATIPRYEMVTKLGHRITVAHVSAHANAITERTKRRELVNG